MSAGRRGRGRRPLRAPRPVFADPLTPVRRPWPLPGWRCGRGGGCGGVPADDLRPCGRRRPGPFPCTLTAPGAGRAPKGGRAWGPCRAPVQPPGSAAGRATPGDRPPGWGSCCPRGHTAAQPRGGPRWPADRGAWTKFACVYLVRRRELYFSKVWNGERRRWAAGPDMPRAPFPPVRHLGRGARRCPSAVPGVKPISQMRPQRLGEPRSGMRAPDHQAGAVTAGTLEPNTVGSTSGLECGPAFGRRTERHFRRPSALGKEALSPHNLGGQGPDRVSLSRFSFS